ncbi:MAG: DUF378 domain-containing protein [Candidatus Peregrinibacteria bacterium]
MLKHKALCFVVGLLLFVGGLNWGLIGLGGFLGNDLNVVHMLLGNLPWLEWVIYLLVGLSALIFGYSLVTHGGKCKCCVDEGGASISNAPSHGTPGV